MLKDSCRRFREELLPEPDATDHRRSCAECDAWAGDVEAGAEWTRTVAESDRPLPANLRDRLRSIPRQITTCRETDRLYAAARQRAAGQAPDPVTAEHLAACDRCRTLYGTLQSAFSETLPPPPPRLFARLKKIARPAERRLPVWIAEPRLATAACILMTVLLSSMASDAAALFRDAGGAVHAQAAVWAEEGGTRGRKMWETAATATAANYETSREHLAGFTKSSEMFFHQTVRIFGSITELYKKTPDGGQSNGEPDSESE